MPGRDAYSINIIMDFSAVFVICVNKHFFMVLSLHCFDLSLFTGERFNPHRGGDWQEVTEMFSARSNFATVLLDDMIFVIGGFNGK
jgi:hypothetical protein